MFQIVLDERKGREIEPTMRLLRECLEEVDRQRKRGAQDALVRDRIRVMLDFFETMSDGYEQLRRLPRRGLLQVVRMGAKVRRLISAGS